MCVQELSAQLVSTLEELSAREKELEEHDELLRRCVMLVMVLLIMW